MLFRSNLVAGLIRGRKASDALNILQFSRKAMAVDVRKVLASGLQEFGSTVVADSKSAFEAITADVKELAAVKSPADFFKLQSEMLRRNFDAAVAAGSKNTEAMFKLTNDAFAPISSRVSLAVEKVSKAA